METQKNILIGISVALALAVVGYSFYSSAILRNAQTENLTPAPGQAKINIQAVCEGALAYMTFTDAASAEVFVAECIEGKHPEVIQNYIQQLNLGEGVAI